MYKTRFSDDDIIEMRRMILEGVPLPEVANRFQTSMQYVYRIRSNDLRRGLGVDCSGVKPICRTGKDAVPEIIRLYVDEHWTEQTIAEHFGVSQTRISDLLCETLYANRPKRKRTVRRSYR